MEKSKNFQEKLVNKGVNKKNRCSNKIAKSMVIRKKQFGKNE